MEVHLTTTRVGAGSGAGVNRAHRVDEGVTPAEHGSAASPVGLLGVQEEGLVEAADLAQGLGAEKQDRADHVVASCTKPAEAESLDARSPRCGEGPSHASGLS